MFRLMKSPEMVDMRLDNDVGWGNLALDITPPENEALSVIEFFEQDGKKDELRRTSKFMSLAVKKCTNDRTGD